MAIFAEMKNTVSFKILWCVIVVIIVSAGFARAQQTDKTLPGNINGLVLFADDEEPLENATIQLLQGKDSTVVASTASNKSGYFQLKDVMPENYILKVSFISFANWYYNINKRSFDKKEISVPRVMLEEESIMLSEAVVVGQMPELVVKEDTLEYNPGAFKLEGSAVVEDLLKRLPGVEVDTDGAITVAGKRVNRITVDGENFFGNDPTMTTKNLEIDIIEKLQIIEKKSDLEEITGIDDGNRETIINLTIKEDRKKGWINNIEAGGGSLVRDMSVDNILYASRSMINRFSGDNKYSLIVNASNNSPRGQGISSNSSLGLNLINVFSEKFKMTGGVTYSHNDNFVQRNSFRQNILVDSVSYRSSESENKNSSNNMAVDYRFEYKPTGKTTILFTPKLSVSRSHSNDTSFTSTMAGDAERTEVNRSSRRGTGKSENMNMSGGLIVSQEFEKKGRRATISMNGNYVTNENLGTNISENIFFLMPDRNSILNQESVTDTRSRSFSVNASYVEPIFKSNFLQFSYTYRNNYSQNLRNTYDYDPETEDFTNLNKDYSKSLENEFANQTISVSFRSVKPKLSYNAGLNIEPSNIRSKSFIVDGIAVGVDSIVHDPGGRDVVNYAPNADFTYRFSTLRNIRFTYRGNTSQPSVTQLDPTEDITNPLHIRSGNADLLPSFSNNLSLIYNFSDRTKQQSTRLTLNYSFVLNEIINKTMYEANTGVQKTFPINQNGIWNSSARLLYNTPLDKNKKLQLTSNTDMSFRNQIGYMSFKEDTETKNTAKTLSMSENLSVSFRQSWLYLQARGTVRYSTTRNSLEERKNQEDMNYSTSLNAQVDMPYDWIVQTGVRYSGQTGLSTGYNRNETIWDVDLSKKIFKSKRGTVSLKWTDLLQQRLSIRRNVTSNYIEDSESNVLTGYVLVSFAYRFNSMGGGGGRGRGSGGEGGGRGGEFRGRPMY